MQIDTPPKTPLPVKPAGPTVHPPVPVKPVDADKGPVDQRPEKRPRRKQGDTADQPANNDHDHFDGYA